jgi:hypothetical protein
MLPQTLHGEPQVTGWTGDQKCEQGPKPMLAARLQGTMAMLHFSQQRGADGERGGFTCYVTPSYTGGKDDAFVAGKLRRPQCFGSHREAWAQPRGTFWTVHGEEPEGLALVVDSGSGWLLAPRLELA